MRKSATRNVLGVVATVTALGQALFLGVAAARAQKSAVRAKGMISVAQANAAALRRYPGRIVGRTPLENEEGVWQYGVMVRSGKTLREVMVNAKTGHIDSVEVTNRAKEAAEARADAARAAAAKHSRGAAKKD